MDRLWDRLLPDGSVVLHNLLEFQVLEFDFSHISKPRKGSVYLSHGVKNGGGVVTRPVFLLTVRPAVGV